MSSEKFTNVLTNNWHIIVAIVSLIISTGIIQLLITLQREKRIRKAYITDLLIECEENVQEVKIACKRDNERKEIFFWGFHTERLKTFDKEYKGYFDSL